MNNKSLESDDLGIAYLIKLYGKYSTEMKPYLPSFIEAFEFGSARYENGNKHKTLKIHRDGVNASAAYMIINSGAELADVKERNDIAEMYFFTDNEKQKEVTLRPNQVLYTHECRTVKQKAIKIILKVVIYIVALSIAGILAKKLSGEFVFAYTSRLSYPYTITESLIAANISRFTYILIMGLGFFCAHRLSKAVTKKYK